MAPTTDVMEMMRPERCFIIGRTQARARRKAAVRSVSTTSFQASSFMRITSVSRVMPALLTRTSMRPNSATVSATALAEASPSQTLSTMPRPLPSSSAMRAVMRSAPASLVAVPTTVAPAFTKASRMAAPMPRLVPVTSATRPSSALAENVVICLSPNFSSAFRAPRRARRRRRCCGR